MPANVSAANDSVTFAELPGIDRRTAASLEKAGLTHAFPIQAAVVPVGIRGRDLLVKSPTGSGKTLAFGLPLIERISAGTSQPTALVLVPTRELAVQVCEDLAPIARGKQLRCTAVYGGAAIVPQARNAGRSAIVVATPGRLDDLIRNRMIDIKRVRMLVLDEADRMLDMGFQPQVDQIVDTLGSTRQTMLFSATLDGLVGELAAAYTTDPETITNHVAPGAGGEINHVMMLTTSSTKVDTVLDALADERDLAVVFVRTKRGADRLKDRLREYGHRSTAIHGGMSQGQRLREYRRFQNGFCDVLVATDVFARGMDLDRITHVINYDLPEDADTYRHRTGRTGRAGRTGTAITLFMSSQRKPLRRMAREAGLPLSMFDEPRRPSGKHWKQVPEADRFTDTPSREEHAALRRDDKPRRSRGAEKRQDKRQRPPQRRTPSSTPNSPKPTGNRAARRAHLQAAWRDRHGATDTRPARPQALSGTVLSFDPNKGFGFIAPDVGGSDVFFHHKRIEGSTGGNPLRKGQRVTFGVEVHERGPRASRVKLEARSARR